METLAETIIKKKDTIYMINILTGEKFYYKNLILKAIAISNKIQQEPVVGDCIGIMVKTPELLVSSILACWIYGLTPAIIDPETPAGRFDSLISKVSPTFLITDDIFRNNYLKSIDIRCVELKEERHEDTDLVFTIDSIKQPCLLLFSSGTTGEPKCIPLSYNNIKTNVFAFAEILMMDQNDTFLCTSPLNYAHGLYNSFLTALILGGKVLHGGVLNLMNTQKILNAASEYNASVAHVTPSMMQIYSIIGKRSKKKLPKFRYVICGTAKLQLKDKERFESIFNIPVTQQYGMSEVLFISVNKDKRIELPESVGIPVGCSIRICNEKGENFGFNKTGDVQVLSHCTFGKYYDQPEITKAAYIDGWFKTGDIGFLNEEGYLTITGRSKEIIKKGGVAISPDEIDSVLLQHDKIVESATIGCLDEVYGEEIYSFVVSLAPTTEQLLREHCSKMLPRTHIPKRIVFIKEFPKTSSGKIIKKGLYQQLKCF